MRLGGRNSKNTTSWQKQLPGKESFQEERTTGIHTSTEETLTYLIKDLISRGEGLYNNVANWMSKFERKFN